MALRGTVKAALRRFAESSEAQARPATPDARKVLGVVHDDGLDQKSEGGHDAQQGGN